MTRQFYLGINNASCIYHLSVIYKEYSESEGQSAAIKQKCKTEKKVLPLNFRYTS